MTIQEAIQGLKNLFSEYELDLPNTDSLEVLHMAFEALEKQAGIERALERLEEASYWTPSSYDSDGYCNDDSDEVVSLEEALEIIKEEVG